MNPSYITKISGGAGFHWEALEPGEFPLSLGKIVNFALPIFIIPCLAGRPNLGKAEDIFMNPKEGIRFLLYSSPPSPRMKFPSPPCNISYLGSKVGKKPIWTPQALIWRCILFTHYLWQYWGEFVKQSRNFIASDLIYPHYLSIWLSSHIFLWELNWKHITSDHITFKQISVQWYIISLTCWSISFCAWSSSPLISASSIACLVSCSLSKAY